MTRRTTNTSHVQLADATLTVAELERSMDLIARLSGLAGIARMVFLDRNARGMPKRDRAAIKAAARPHLRRAIAVARLSRDALVGREIERHELLRDRARMHLALARIEFFAPYVDEVSKRYRVVENMQPKGAAARAEVANTANRYIDTLIEAALTRGERVNVTELAAEHGVHRNTIQNRVNKIKAEKTRR